MQNAHCNAKRHNLNGSAATSGGATRCLIALTSPLLDFDFTHCTRQSVCHPCPAVRTDSCETSDPSTWRPPRSRSSTRPKCRHSPLGHRSWPAAAHTVPSCCSENSQPGNCPAHRAAISPNLCWPIRSPPHLPTGSPPVRHRRRWSSWGCALGAFVPRLLPTAPRTARTEARGLLEGEKK